MAFSPFASVLASGLLALGVAGCGSPADESESTTAAPPSAGSESGAGASRGTAEAEQSPGSTDTEPVEITIEDFEFSGPASVAPGSTVMVVNEDSSSHTVTSEAGDFEEVIVEGGADGSLTAPTEPGEYAYVCDFHPEMIGTLVVK